MYLAILTLPLLSATVAGFLGRKVGKTGSHFITCGSLVLTALLAFVAFYEVGLCQSPVSIKLMSWIDSEFMLVSWGFNYDSLTVSMLLPVLIVSALVHIYSTNYMGEDPHNQRFFSYLSMFTFFMLMLVTGDNYLVMFIGWEGVGISSYLLINFWFTRLQANKAAIKALVMNRVGDWGFSIGLWAIFWAFGNLDFTTVFSLAPFMNEELITVISICLLIAAMGKSAQIGLHTWLPDAMEGPTPVSALIHAATMVTAGVYLLLRSSPILEYGSTPLILITWVGALTAFFAATTGLLQNDLKRVIAYSTCSQLGYMVFACGLSNYSIGIFHLVNHAFFKALLFLSAGAVIHALNDEQDMRKMGGLVNLLPFTYTMILIGSLSLMALPFLTGFYSKDLILEVAFGQYLFTGNVAYWLGTISAVFTAFYSLRLLALTFLTYPNGPKINYLGTHEAPLIMAIPLVLLAIMSVFFGYVTKDLFIGVGTNFWGNSLFVHPNHVSLIEAEFAIPTFYKLLPLFGSLFGGGLALVLYHLFPLFTISLTENTLGRTLYRFLNQKYWFDNIYNNLILSKLLNFGYTTNKTLDRGVIELVGPYGLVNVFKNASSKITSLDTGFIPSYAMYIFSGLILFITLIFYVGDPRLFLLLLWAVLLLPSKKNA
ncbi:NADH dehydrogenase subunit 5 (mitochondrion) [Umbelopsis nana]|jgi:NADH-ubiquinone oxidoreductase chain 5